MSEKNTIERERLHGRGLTSLIVTLAFIVLATTGVVLYISPQGRVANWTGWSVLGLSKRQWIAVHTTMALLFIMASGFHIYFNWQPLLRYFVLKRKLHLKREMIGAVVVVAGVFAGALFEIPPFSSIVALTGHAKGHGGRQDSTPTDIAESSVSQERFAGPQKGHGAGLGRQTIQGLCEHDRIPLEKAVSILRQAGFTANPQSTLKALAEQKNITPAQVRDLLVGKNK